MTAGTDSPDPAEPSHTVKMPSLMQISHFPYLDHNYGQPPPMTPPDSNSPAPDDADTGNEDDEGNAVTRCICGFDHDDGYMICCDKCSVWQHIECMGISSESLPDSYLCDQCEPRPLDRDRAKGIQMKKKEEMSDDDDDDNDESAEETDGTTYTAFSNTPTRLTLTAKVSHSKRKITGPKVKGEKDKDKKTKRRKRQKQRIPIPEFLPVDEETNGPWESNCNNGDCYQEVKECTYSHGLEEFANTLSEQVNGVRYIPDGIEQHCKVVEVQRNIKGLVATEDLHKDQFLIQFKGKMMLGSEFDEENQMFRRYNPYVLFYYTNSECPKLCVDARVLGNEARFIRRSCSPNAEVRHTIQNGKLSLAVFSQIPLPKGVEITIPFEFAFSDYHCSLTCACAQDTCAVAKYKLKYQIPGQELNSVAEQNGHRICDDSSNSSHNPLNASPLRATLSTQNSFQGDSDSDLDNNQDRSNEAESSRRKLSREERKLEAYVKQIERLEKKEKKRQQPQKEHRQAVRMSSDDGTKPPVMRCPKRLNHKRRSNGTSSGLKKKRSRASSCSSEPLSPDEVSSSASTPTTPKPVSTIPEEPQTETPSTSPSRNFRFTKAKADENCHEAVSTSALSSPTSPCSPRESETETKPTLSTASSNSDIAMEMEMDDSDNGHVEESQEEQTRDIESDLSVRLAEITSVSRSECNTPSPCPSTSASPTRCESVMNGCPPNTSSANGGRSPGPAPGSPLAALLHSAHSTRSNPLYCSLKKRWLYKFLNSQNGVGIARPLNGVRTALTFIERPKATAVNHKTVTMPTYKEPLPLKKRYLRNGNGSRKADAAVTSINNTVGQSVYPVITSPTVVSNCSITTRPSGSPPISTVSYSESNKHELEKQVLRIPSGVEMDTKTTRTELTVSDTRTLSSGHDMVSDTTTTPIVYTIGQGTLDTIPDVKPVVISTGLVRQTSDPRQQSPLSQLSSTGLPTLLQPSLATVTTAGSTIVQSSGISSGTPGKKKVSLLEYRNRSLQRLSGDGPKPSSLPSMPQSTNNTTPSTASLPTSTTPVKPSSTSVPSINQQITPKKPDSAGANGPSIEPISPEGTERFPMTRLKLDKLSNSPLYEAKMNSLAKKEAGVNMYNKRLSALISEQLLNDPVRSPSSSKSPSTASSSPSLPPPPPPPPDTAGKGDAMEIEEEDSQADQTIYVTSHLVSPSRPHLQPPHQPTIIPDYNHPQQIPQDYRLHDHAQSSLLTQMIQPSSSQLPSPLSGQPSPLASHTSASPYLVTAASQPIPSQVRFPASYQNPSVQNAPYYQ